MENQDLNIETRLTVGFIFGWVGLFSVSWYVPIAAIFGWEEFPFILIAGVLWFSVKMFQLRFLSHVYRFLQNPDVTKLRRIQLYLVLYLAMFLAEIVYFTFRGFWITDWVLNILEAFLLINCIQIYRETQKATMVNGEPLGTTG